MVGILHLLVRAGGTEEPVWRLSQADPDRPGYLLAEIDEFAQEKEIARLPRPTMVQADEMAMYVHRDFETFFRKTCGVPFKREMDRLRWLPLEAFAADVAVAPLDTLLALREWAAALLVPKVREKLLQVYRSSRRAVASAVDEFELFEEFHQFLETALFSVDSVSGAHYLEFLYWQGAAYLLQKYEAGVKDLHELRAAHLTPTCSRADFYLEVALRKNNIVEEVIAADRMENVDRPAASTQQGAARLNKFILPPMPAGQDATQRQISLLHQIVDDWVPLESGKLYVISPNEARYEVVSLNGEATSLPAREQARARDRDPAEATPGQRGEQPGMLADHPV
ncbi:MAG: hypothetical protein H7835_01610 [Magnetococcus sp. XQGC-1]